MNTGVLFNSSSVATDSPTFMVPVGGQYTIVAVGMQPGDYITFEVIEVAAGSRSTVCGCRISGMGDAVVLNVQQLMCPTCESDTPQPVRLTERNPVVVLDSPQGVLLRAIYHGDGVPMGTVTVWWTATEVQDLTELMRGCPPVCCEDEEQTWTETGEQRCTGENIERRELSNCGNYRWVDTGTAVEWLPSGAIICSRTDNTTLLEEFNQCGERRLVPGPEQEWVSNCCHECVDFTCRRSEVNQCGFVRWVDTGEPCGESRHSVTSVVCLGAVEEGGDVCWQVNLNEAVQGVEPLTIHFTLSGDEQDIHNYPAPVLVIPVGQASGIVCVPTTDDDAVENTRSLCITAMVSTRLFSVPAAVCCSVLDNDSEGVSEHSIVSVVCNGPVEEGDPLTWTVTLDSPVVGSNLVLSTTLSGTEQDDHAYAAPDITILVGANSGQATINTIDDAVDDGTRSLCLAINANARVSNAPYAAVCCSVLDNDGGADSTHDVLSVACSSVVEGSLMCWTVTLDAPVSGNDLLISSTLSGDESLAHGYVAPSVVIPVGFDSGLLCVPTVDDEDVEGPLDLCLTVNTSARILSVPAAECCTVVDNDTEEETTYEITIECPPTTVDEGGLVTWTVNVSPTVADAPLSISFNLSGDETTGHAYAVTPNPLVIGIGETTGEVEVQTEDDDLNEPDRTLCLQAEANLPRVPLPSNLCCVTIANEDPVDSTHTVTEVECDGPTNEGGTMCWTITLDSPVAGNDLTVNTTLSGSEQDVHAYPGPSIIIPVGMSSGNACVNITDDAIIEGTLQLCLTVNTSARIAAVPAAVCCDIVDDDFLIELSGGLSGTCCNAVGPSGGLTSTYTVTFGADGSITESDSCGMNLTGSYWAQGAFDPADYEVFVIATGGPAPGHPSNSGIWINLATSPSFVFGGIVCAVSCLHVYSYNIAIRPAGGGPNITTDSVAVVELNRNNDCE
jgi:hypothetical protein